MVQGGIYVKYGPACKSKCESGSWAWNKAVLPNIVSREKVGLIKYFGSVIQFFMTAWWKANLIPEVSNSWLNDSLNNLTDWLEIAVCFVNRKHVRVVFVTVTRKHYSCRILGRKYMLHDPSHHSLASLIDILGPRATVFSDFVGLVYTDHCKKSFTSQ